MKELNKKAHGKSNQTYGGKEFMEVRKLLWRQGPTVVVPNLHVVCPSTCGPKLILWQHSTEREYDTFPPQQADLMPSETET